MAGVGSMAPPTFPIRPATRLRKSVAQVAMVPKRYLVDLASVIATDRLCPVAYFGESVEELDKKLTGLLLGGVPLISIDNVRRQLDSDLLCQACERPLLELRRLGKSDTFTTPNGACMFSTGNNLLLSGEMIRRALLSTLDAGVERPEQRTFRGDPIAAVQANRGLYIAAVLTIIRAYLAAGRPAEQTPLGSYAAWCKLVREPLIWLGKADPVASQEVVRQTDPVLGTLLEVMQGWERVIGLFVPKTTLAVKTLVSNGLPRRSGERDDEWKRRQLCLAV
jgi:putative DNA primase/helicase